MRKLENIDSYSNPVFNIKNKLARCAWWIFYVFLFKTSPKPMFFWRRFLLRIFGAKLGKGVAVYPTAKIWAPWNLVCKDMVAIANGAEIYNPKIISLGSHAIISQDAYLCGASHHYNEPGFSFVSEQITVGDYAWICARSSVMPGVTIHDGAILGLGSVATRDLAPWSVYAGVPAKFIKERTNILDKIN